MSEFDDRAAVAHEDVCRYIAACYYQPEPMFEEEGMFESLQRAASLVYPDLVPYAQRLGDEFRRTRMDDLLLDYTRLFLGPAQILAKPYGSIWLEEEQTLMGDTTMAVLELYQEGGFEIDEEFRELPDHIAVELEFLYLLVFRGNEARRSGDATRMSLMSDLKARFLAQHLGRWVGPFTHAVRQGAQCGFYRSLAEMTKLFVEHESRNGDN